MAQSDDLIEIVLFFFFKQKTAYEMRISDWSSDVCSSDLYLVHLGEQAARGLLSHLRRRQLRGLGRIVAGARERRHLRIVGVGHHYMGVGVDDHAASFATARASSWMRTAPRSVAIWVWRAGRWAGSG